MAISLIIKKNEVRILRLLIYLSVLLGLDQPERVKICLLDFTILKWFYYSLFVHYFIFAFCLFFDRLHHNPFRLLALTHN